MSSHSTLTPHTQGSLHSPRQAPNPSTVRNEGGEVGGGEGGGSDVLEGLESAAGCREPYLCEREGPG